MPSEALWTWPAMLNAFRAFGGVAENIRNGNSGSGLHAQDASRPISLSVPPNLCFALDDIEFIDGDIKLKDSANAGPGERNFFDAYSRTFSWGAGGGAEVARSIALLDSLPSEVRGLLENEMSMPHLFQGDPAERAQQRYLWSRRFRWKNRDWFVPIAELTRHGERTLQPALDSDGRFRIQGTVPGEILISRGALDTLGVYLAFGVVEPQNQAYSLPGNLDLGAIDLHIGRDTARTVKRGKFLLPEVTRDEQTMAFSFLMTGNVKVPRLSRGIFLDLARDTPIVNPDETFDQILFANRRCLLQLLGELEPHRGEAVIALRKVAQIQLERISHCIGTRDL